MDLPATSQPSSSVLDPKPNLPTEDLVRLSSLLVLFTRSWPFRPFLVLWKLMEVRLSFYYPYQPFLMYLSRRYHNAPHCRHHRDCTTEPRHPRYLGRTASTRRIGSSSLLSRSWHGYRVSRISESHCPPWQTTIETAGFTFRILNSESVQACQIRPRRV